MDSFFKDVAGGIDKVEQEFLGPDYYYYKQISTPSELGVSSEGSIGAAEQDTAAIINYVQLLVAGTGPASKTGKPLGDKFFLKTGGQCTDVASKQKVARYIYVNNVPDGHIPLISSGLGVDFTVFEGLLPGVLEDVGRLDPMALFSSFMQGAEPPCTEITMQTISPTNSIGSASHFVANSEISNMDPCWFPDSTNPLTGAGCQQAFTSNSKQYRRMEADLAAQRGDKRHAQAHKRKTARLYTLAFGALVLYLIYRMSRR